MWGIVVFVSWKCKLCCFMSRLILMLCRLWNLFVLCFRSWSFKTGDCCHWKCPYFGALPSSFGRWWQNSSVRRLQLPGWQPSAERCVSPGTQGESLSYTDSCPVGFYSPHQKQMVFLGTLNIPYWGLISVLQSSTEMLWGAFTAKEHPTLNSPLIEGTVSHTPFFCSASFGGWLLGWVVLQKGFDLWFFLLFWDVFVCRRH